MEEYTDNSTAIEHIIESGDLEEVRTILGDSERIRYSGIIRAGIKVPKKNCTQQELKLFKELEAQGIPYDEIDRKIGGQPRSRNSKLFPSNSDYFVIRDCDFQRPADAQYIRENYADEDGHVREIPIWIATGDLNVCIPHNYRAFDGGSNLRAYSYYEGAQLMLRYIPKHIQQPKKTDWITVAYDPDKPPVDAPECDFGGLYKINVPGVRGLGEVVIPTKSWNGLKDGIAVLRRVREIMGRFHGLMDDQPFLKLCKVPHTVKDKEGKRVKQYIVTIDTIPDAMELAKYAARQGERGMAALRFFNGQKASRGETLVAPAPRTQSAPTFEDNSAPKQQTKNQPGASAVDYKKPVPQVEREPVKPEPAKEATPAKSVPAPTQEAQSPLAPEVDQTAEARKSVYALGQTNGLSLNEVDAYAKFKLGKSLIDETDYSRLQRLYGELRVRLQADAQAVKAKCQEMLAASPKKALVKSRKASTSLDPEIEAMLVEFNRLAENNDLLPEHLQAHLVALTGTAIEAMTLDLLQNCYREVEARIGKGNIDGFKREIEGNFRELYKRAA